MTNLNRIVTDQGEEINSIENNVEASKMQTRMGLLEIIKARRAKFASVPVAGAVVGKLTHLKTTHTYLKYDLDFMKNSDF